MVCLDSPGGMIFGSICRGACKLESVHRVFSVESEGRDAFLHRSSLMHFGGFGLSWFSSSWVGHGVERQSDEFGRDVEDDVLMRVLVEAGRVDKQGRGIFGQEGGERDGVSWRSGERESWWRGVCGM
jgi:hypothetical protein